MDFVQFVKQEKIKTDQSMSLTLDKLISESASIDADYGEFAKEIKTLCLRGGKRLRSLLVRLSYQLVSKQEPTFDLVAVSTYAELLHLFILIHDDIADRDLKRYGGPTLEVRYGELLKQKFDVTDNHFGLSLAMIAGDLLHVLGNGMIIDASIDDVVRPKVMRHMQHVLHQVIAGWYIHFWQNQLPLNQATTERYLKGMELVSASYTVQGPLELGLLLAEQKEPYSKVLNEYGYHVGMAFQIQDDILGVFGDSDKTGKPSGNDIREGKKTLLALKAYQEGSSEQKRFLETVVGKSELSDDELEQVRTIITDTKSLDYSVKTAKEHIAKAHKTLDSLENVQSEPLQRLHQIAEFVLQRSY